MKTYKELKREITETPQNFDGVFWAFNKDQFNKGLKKLGLKECETDKLAILGAGGYVLAEKKASYWQLVDTLQGKMKEALKDQAFLLEALIYELINHEFIYTYDASDALASLALNSKDIPSELLNEAKREAVRRCE